MGSWRGLKPLTVVLMLTLLLSTLALPGMALEGGDNPSDLVYVQIGENSTYRYEYDGFTVDLEFAKEGLSAEGYYRRYQVTVNAGNRLAAAYQENLVSIAVPSEVTTDATAREYAKAKWSTQHGGRTFEQYVALRTGDLQKRLRALRAAPGLSPSSALLFEDLGSVSWAEAAIVRARLQGLVKGRSDRAYAPSDPVSKVESLVLAVRLLGYEDYAKVFTEGPPLPATMPAWAAGYWWLAKAGGVLSNDEDNTDWTAPADRGLIALGLAQALDLKPPAGATLTFTDAADITGAERNAVLAASGAGLLKGYEDGTFRPRRQVTRAEMAIMLTRAANRLSIWNPQVTGNFENYMAGTIIVGGQNVRVASDAHVSFNGRPSSLAVLLPGDKVFALLDRGDAKVIWAEGAARAEGPEGFPVLAGLLEPAHQH